MKTGRGISGLTYILLVAILIVSVACSKTGTMPIDAVNPIINLQYPDNSATEHIALDVNAPSSTVSPLINGQNLGIWAIPNEQFDEKAVVAETNTIHPNTIRFIGGTLGDGLLWTRDNSKSWHKSPGKQSTLGWLTPKDIDEAAKFAKKTNSELIMQTNARIHNASLAADMVRYANKEKGYGIKYWTIGNEPDLWSGSFPLGEGEPKEVLEPEFYAKTVVEYAKAMKEVDPTIQIIAPECACDNTDIIDAIARNPEAHAAVDIISFHHYALLGMDTNIYAGLHHVTKDANGSLIQHETTPFKQLVFGENTIQMNLSQDETIERIGLMISSERNDAVDAITIGKITFKNATDSITLSPKDVIASDNFARAYVIGSAWQGSPYLNLREGKNILSVPIPRSINKVTETGIQITAIANRSLVVKRVYLSGPEGEKTIATNSSAIVFSKLDEDTTGYDSMNFEVIWNGPSHIKKIEAKDTQATFTYDMSPPGKNLVIFSKDINLKGFDTVEMKVIVPYLSAAQDHTLTTTYRLSDTFSKIRSIVPEKPIAMTEYGPYIFQRKSANDMGGAIWTLKTIEELAKENAALAASFDLADVTAHGIMDVKGNPTKRYFAFVLNAMSESNRLPVGVLSDPALFTSARISDDKLAMTIILINEHITQDKNVAISVGKKITSAESWLLDENNDAKKTDSVKFSNTNAEVRLPPYSVTLVRLKINP